LPVFRRKHFDGDELAMGEYLFSGQITAKDANIGNAIARRRKPRSLFLNSPNVPFFFMLIKPEQNCPLHQMCSYSPS